MERIKVGAISFLTAFILLFMPRVNSMPQLPQPQPQGPLCVSQLALANYACGRLPSLYSAPEPEPPSDLLFPDGHRHGHRHGHEHEHEQGRHVHTPDDDCCRWLRDIDDECVCSLLVRLPPFLSKTLHQYSVIIGDTCNVTYNCNGRV